MAVLVICTGCLGARRAIGYSTKAIYINAGQPPTSDSTDIKTRCPSRLGIPKLSASGTIDIGIRRPGDIQHVIVIRLPT